jgi:hypothetical protein
METIRVSHYATRRGEWKSVCGEWTGVKGRYHHLLFHNIVSVVDCPTCLESPEYKQRLATLASIRLQGGKVEDAFH